MLELGFSLSSEEHRPIDLVRQAVRAEEVGFSFALISDHFHPWTDAQGQSPFVWCVIGAIAEATERLRLGTGVTCPLLRIHPVIIAQAAATAAALMPGRFFLGLGAGENLNEHVTGARWPTTPERREMLEEAIEVMRLLWQGGSRSHHGRYYTVDEARLYTLPEEPPHIYVAAGGSRSAQFAGRLGDGLISTEPDRELITDFESGGGDGKPRYGQLTVCWAPSDEEAQRTAHDVWPNAALEGSLSWDLKTPRAIEDATATARVEDVAKKVVCGPNVKRHIKAIREFADAGFDHVYVHQVGPDQEGFFSFYEREVLAAFR
jgi:G6PDH family F420-dependent oxidoreductase